MKEACGVFGIFGNGNVARFISYGLIALQHRGQESAGVVVSDKKMFYSHVDMGLVSYVLGGDVLDRLKGHLGIGHVRYSTTGGSNIANTQPIKGKHQGEEFWVGHNGNLINTEDLRGECEKRGYKFKGTTDTEVICALISFSEGKTLIEALKSVLKRLKGAFCLVVLTQDQVIGARDPFGIRPLCLGKGKDYYAIASESCALDIVDAQLIRDIQPGEIVVLDENGAKSEIWADEAFLRICIFEYIYFARPDSVIQGQLVYSVRKRLGELLAKEHPVEADIVVPVPRSAVSAALGFARELGIPFELGIYRNDYIHRTFIAPEQKLRELTLFLKLNAVRKVLHEKRIVVVDDSIVRGTTSRRIVKILREAGALEVHMRILFDVIKHCCFLGIDTATRQELIGASLSKEEIRRYIEADSLGFLSGNLVVQATGLPEDQLSTCCFSGKYPYPELCERV